MPSLHVVILFLLCFHHMWVHYIQRAREWEQNEQKGDWMDTYATSPEQWQQWQQWQQESICQKLFRKYPNQLNLQREKMKINIKRYHHGINMLKHTMLIICLNLRGLQQHTLGPQFDPFNTIRPLLLQDKLAKMRVDPCLVSLISSYLTDRPQYVRWGLTLLSVAQEPHKGL